jgi:hypothetical protein
VDIVVLIEQVEHRTTNVKELFSTSINYGGYGDACTSGLYCVFFPLNSPVEFTVFRLQPPVDIQTRFHSSLATMDDLEISSSLLLTMMLEASGAPLKHRQTAAWSNTTPTMGWVWVWHMATKQSKIAGRLL